MTRWIAILTALAFGCVTSRPPSTSTGGSFEPTQRVALAEPELELWMEGTGAIDPAESAQALAQSRDALSHALAGRGLDDVADPDQLLFVHARAIARTNERRSAQTWSAVAIVFVFVAIVVTAIVGSQRSSRRGPSPAAVRPIAPGRPGPYAPAYLPRRHPPPPIFGVNVGLAVGIPLTPEPVPWIAPTEAWLASRGWWDGDEVELTVELTDARTGAVSWHRTVRAGIDPRDEAALAAAIDRALEGLGLGERAVGAPHPDEQPPPPEPADAAAASPAPEPTPVPGQPETPEKR